MATTTSEQKKKAKKKTREEPWQAFFRGKKRREAIMNGFENVMPTTETAEDPGSQGLPNADRLGFMCQLVTLAPEPIRSKARPHMISLATRWSSGCSTWWANNNRSLPPPEDTASVFQLLRGMQLLERSGVAHTCQCFPDLIRALEQWVQRGGLCAALGQWDPRTSPPGGPNPCKSLSRGLLLTSLVHDILGGFPCLAHCPAYSHVLQWLPQQRPYKGLEEMGPEAYADQVELVATVVLTMSGLGSLQLLPSLFPHELHFLREHLPSLMYDRHLNLVVHALQALKAFVVEGMDEEKDKEAVGRLALGFVLATQRKNGSWRELAENVGEAALGVGGVATSLTHESILAICPWCPVGFGPLPVPGVMDLLLAWQRKDMTVAAQTHGQLPGQIPTLPGPAAAGWSIQEGAEQEAETEADGASDFEAQLMKDARILKFCYQSGDWQGVSWILTKFLRAGEQVTGSHLVSTGVGQLVLSLRESGVGGPEVTSLSRQLVAFWEQMLLRSLHRGGSACSSSTG